MLKHLTIYFPRGDGDSFVVRNIAGKHDDRKVVVSLLESDELTAGLLWQKKNTLAGGSDAEVLVTYDANRDTSDFEVTLLRDDTEALANSKYFISLSSTSVADSEDHETLVTADFVLQPSGESVMNGVIEEGEKFVPVKLSEVEDGQHIKRVGASFVGVNLNEEVRAIINSQEPNVRWVFEGDSIQDAVSEVTNFANNVGTIGTFLARVSPSGTFTVQNNGNIFRARDGGLKWRWVGSLSGGRFSRYGNYCATNSALYKITDDEISEVAVDVRTATPFEGANLVIYIANTKRVIISADYGVTFPQITDPLPIPYAYDYYLFVWNDEIIVFCPPQGAYRLMEDGVSWESISFPFSSTIADPILTEDGEYYCVSNGIMYRLTNNLSDAEIIPTPEGNISSVTVSLGGSMFVSIDNSETFRSIDGGDTWESLGFYSYGIAGISNELIYGEYQVGVFKSTDNGDSWTEANGDPRTKGCVFVTAGMYDQCVGLVKGVNVHLFEGAQIINVTSAKSTFYDLEELTDKAVITGRGTIKNLYPGTTYYGGIKIDYAQSRLDVECELIECLGGTNVNGFQGTCIDSNAIELNIKAKRIYSQRNTCVYLKNYDSYNNIDAEVIESGRIGEYTTGSTLFVNYGLETRLNARLMRVNNLGHIISHRRNLLIANVETAISQSNNPSYSVAMIQVDQGNSSQVLHYNGKYVLSKTSLNSQTNATPFLLNQAQEAKIHVSESIIVEPSVTSFNPPAVEGYGVNVVIKSKLISCWRAAYFDNDWNPNTTKLEYEVDNFEAFGEDGFWILNLRPTCEIILKNTHIRRLTNTDVSAGASCVYLYRMKGGALRLKNTVLENLGTDKGCAIRYHQRAYDGTQNTDAGIIELDNVQLKTNGVNAYSIYSNEAYRPGAEVIRAINNVLMNKDSRYPNTYIVNPNSVIITEDL